MKFRVFMLLASFCGTIARAGGIDWPDNRLLPTLPKPAAVLDCIELDPYNRSEASLFASLEGIVNRTEPRIACLTDNDGDGQKTWLKLHHLAFTTINGYDALLKYRTNITGLVVTDPDMPDTLNLATTIAGVKNELICRPYLLDRLTNAPYNFSIIDDLRGRFADKYAVYRYLYKNYWPKCTHRLLAGLSPRLGGKLREYLVAMKVAVVWLDPGRKHPEDRDILALFASHMKPAHGLYLGWWPGESDGLNWIAHYGVPVLASDFFDNATVFGGVTEAISPAPVPSPPPLENKIYVAMIVSDGDNVQYMQHVMKRIWDGPGRGSVPIGWTVSPLSTDMDPAMLNYYWRTATTNDCLVSGPSGSGYTHIQEWKHSHLNLFTKLTEPYLERSGLRIITVWDRVTSAAADAYARNCPSLLGLTDQAGGTYSKVDKGLRTIGLTIAYSGQTNAILSGITNAAAKWDGSAPMFIGIQANVWFVRPPQLREIADALDPRKFVIVRPDHLFMLYNEAAGGH